MIAATIAHLYPSPILGTQHGANCRGPVSYVFTAKGAAAGMSAPSSEISLRDIHFLPALAPAEPLAVNARFVGLAQYRQSIDALPRKVGGQV